MFRLLDAGGVVVVAGTTDVGKTTFCLALANACVVRGQTCAVVDGDLGQSEIGPPSAVGWGPVTGTVGALSDIECRNLFFVGSTSPATRLLQTVVAVQRMQAAAAVEAPHLTIVDMPGLAIGPTARSLFAGVISSVQPDRVVMLARGRELDPLGASLRGVVEPEVLVLPAAERARVRSRDERAARRRLKFGAYFAGAASVSLPASSVGITGTSLFCGRPVPMDRLLELETELGVEILHAEETEEQVLVVTGGPVDNREQPRLARMLGGRVLSIAAPEFFENILVGLADERGRHRAIGTIERVDFRGGKLIVSTPLRHAALVRQVIFGAMRVRPDGTEAGFVDPMHLYLFSAAARRGERSNR